MSVIEIPVWPFVYGQPSDQGKIRTVPEDFIVSENLSFEASGAGEHAFLRIEKTNENTDYVARQLARFAGVRQRDIGYAGLKDRHAVTTQWFSVWLPGKPDPDWTQFETDNIRVLQSLRHARKLQRGALSGNRFKLIIREWQGDSAKTNERLEFIKLGGMANYYGEQRFGHRGQNVNKALSLFQGRKTRHEQRSLYLSAARSYLFNHILAARIKQKNWNQAIAGDVFAFDSSRSRFKSDQPEPDIISRVNAGEIHPTGVLWGRGDALASAEALAIEQAVIDDYAEIAEGLVQGRVDVDRRPLRVNIRDLQWQFIGDSELELRFTLPAGSYATALLREIIVL